MQKIQARYYHEGRLSPIKLIVMHSMEAPEKPDTAEAVARWFATSSPQTSAHVCVDQNSAVRCVDDNDTAWAAPNANASGLHIEMAGYAKQTRSQWLDAPSLATLKQAAKVAAGWVKKYGIPIKHLTPAQVRAGQKGFCAHVDVTKAYPGTGSHTDPGPGFPWDRFLALVKAEVDGQPAKPVSWSRTLVYTKGKPMQKGADVEAWQALLNDMGHDVDVDGYYGPASAAATKKLQAQIGVLQSSTVDKTTWQEAHKAQALALADEDKPKPVAWSRTLAYTSGKAYMQGADVEEWQDTLNKLSFKVDVDGLYGPASTAATKKAQAKLNLPETGKVDKTTWQAGQKAEGK